MTHLIDFFRELWQDAFPENSRKAQASSHVSVRMPSISATARLNMDGGTAPDFTIHSRAQASGSIASTNDIISAARLPALPSFTSTVKTNGHPAFHVPPEADVFCAVRFFPDRCVPTVHCGYLYDVLIRHLLNIFEYFQNTHAYIEARQVRPYP